MLLTGVEQFVIPMSVVRMKTVNALEDIVHSTINACVENNQFSINF